MLDGIRNSAQRGAGLTKQLLAFARAQPLEIRSIELKSFLEDVTTLLRPSLRSNIEVIIETSDQLWNVDVDAGALELSLLNLAFNARDAMKDGGSVRISATNQLLEGKPEGLRGEHVALSVADSGAGMSRETMDRVFEPFFTTKSLGEGTGLGLSQVFGFAKQLGGTVTVESRPDEGAVFTLYLPASRSAQPTAVAKANGAHAIGRIFVVEDDEQVAELAAGMLDELGFEAVISPSARDALDRLAGGDKPRLIFSDVMLPGGISGIELAKKVRSRFSEVPILLATGYSEELGRSHGFPVLQKPYEFETLAGAVETILKLELS